MNWKSQIYKTAYRTAADFAKKDWVLGVAIGGSVARGTVWKHSDLELCLLVNKKNTDADYFNYIDGLGVELIQLECANIEAFISEHERSGQFDDIVSYPLQMYKCRVISDKSGLLTRFKEIYDSHLFDDSIKTLKRNEAQNRANKHFADAEMLLAYGKPRSALGALSVAVNALLIAYYWQHGILLRSQNRTVYLLKKQAHLINGNALCKAFTDIYGVDIPTAKMKARFINAKTDLLAFFRTIWGESGAEFLENACDGKLEWGYESSIVYVYKYCFYSRLYEQVLAGAFDDKAYQAKHLNLCCFLGTDETDTARMAELIALYNEAQDNLVLPQKA